MLIDYKNYSENVVNRKMWPKYDETGDEAHGDGQEA